MTICAPASGRASVFDAGAGEGNIANLGDDLLAVGKAQQRALHQRDDPLVATAIIQAATMSVGEPGELISEPVALTWREIHGQRETRFRLPRGHAREAAELIEIDHNLFANPGLDRRKQRHVARRHFNRLAGELPSVFQHVAPEESDGHALKTPKRASVLKIVRFGQGHVFACLRIGNKRAIRSHA